MSVIQSDRWSRERGMVRPLPLPTLHDRILIRRVLRQVVESIEDPAPPARRWVPLWQAPVGPPGKEAARAS